MAKVSFHSDALAEINKSALYLNEQSPDMGDDFLNELEKSVKLISNFPDTWPCVRGNIRRLIITRYHYNIFYRIVSDGSAEILSVEHGRKKPFTFLGRL